MKIEGAVTAMISEYPFNKFVKNVEIVEIHDRPYLKPFEKCIQISTNMPGIDSLIREITCEMLEF